MSKVIGTGPIYVGSTPAPVLHMGSWSVNVSNEVSTFADLQTNAQQSDYGLQSYTGSAEGVTALEDTSGQDVLVAAALDKTKVKDIKFYEKYTAEVGEKVVYWQPKADSGGIVVSTCNVRKDGGSETSTISFSFTNDGLMERKVETV